MGKAQRDKGKRGEYKAIKDFSAIFPEAKRHLESQAQEAMGYDLDNTGKLRIQVKNYKKYCPISKIEEVQSKGDQIPVLVSYEERKKGVVCLYIDDFVRILEDIGVVYDH